MTLVVFPRLSSSAGAAQIFVGDFGATHAREPTFLLDGGPVLAVPLRRMASVRSPQDGVPLNSASPRAFTGVYEIPNLAPGAAHVLEVRVGDEAQRPVIGALPARIPSEVDGGFNILLASCFCTGEHNPATLRAGLAAALSGIYPKPAFGRRPDCSFFMGDQVYLDLPSLTDFPEDRASLAQKFEADYVRNWSGGLAPLLETAPSVCLPDDHEFWNNAPHRSPFIQNSWTKRGQDAWRGAAQTAFDAFARPHPYAGGPGDTPFVLTIAPLSFFLADGRSGRTETEALTGACRAALAGWVQMLNANNYVGVFATGQSLFCEAPGWLVGQVADREMPNYQDFSEIIRTLQGARQPLFALTGDVHWGRVTVAKDATSAARIHEVVVSPLALVTTPGKDQLHRVLGRVKGFFGGANSWPRHSDADVPPERFGMGASRYGCEPGRAVDGLPANVKGDQLALLSFAFDAARHRLSAVVTYYFIDDHPPPPVRVRLLDVSIAV
jgi:hypothetical protein